MRPAKGDDYMRQRNRRNIVIAAVVAACLAIALAVAAVLSPGSPFSAAGANVAATHNGAPVGMAQLCRQRNKAAYTVEGDESPVAPGEPLQGRSVLGDISRERAGRSG